MSEISTTDSGLSMEGATLANDYHWRSTKAKKQLRDRFGRWISLGANVRFRADGLEQAGKVTSVVDGKAYVDQKNRDGSVTQRILEPGDMRVLASKATLPQDSQKIYDENNNFAAAIEKPEFDKILNESGKVQIERADHYALMAELEGFPEEKDESNPIIFQLFAPGGRSLGKYGEEAIGDFDSMVNEDKQPEAPEGEDPAPEGESAPVVASSIITEGEEKPYRVPQAVRDGISAALESFSSLLSESDLEAASRLANDSTVSLSDVQWIHGFFNDIDPAEQVRGGFRGRKWASKILEPVTASFAVDVEETEGVAKYYFDDDSFAYFAVGDLPGSTLVNRLISVDYENGVVFSWTNEGFFPLEGVDILDIDEPQIIPIDEMTAEVLAKAIDSGVGDFDILDSDAEERNLFTLAESELDFEEIDRSFSIIADASGYTPIERSQNAKKQRRGAGGKFGEQPDEKAAVPQNAPVVKARLPRELPLVPDVPARIYEWLETSAEAPVVRQEEEAPEAPVVAAGEAPEYTPEDQAIEDSATGPTDEALYFAIVDPVDKTAVLDAVAIVKTDGQPSAFIRAQGQWTASPDTLTLLQGSTPPAVAELSVPEPVKTVLQQIDDHDAGKDITPEPEALDPVEAENAPMAASGFALADGSYTILDAEDIVEAVVASGANPDIFVKAHIRKRANALNRLDLVPESWREFTLAEIGELSAAETVYGEFGEIIVAAGVPGVADTPSDYKNAARLKAYWTTGKGALKIRWGTPGDLTRAHRHLSKYVGVQRAWGLAQRFHQSLFGVSNYTHDIATGQHKGRRR